MTEQEAYEQVRDNIAKYLNADGEGAPELRDKWWECALLNKARYRRVADEILSDPNILIKHPDQRRPILKVETSSSMYNQGQNDMVDDNWVKVINKEEK